MPLNPYLVRNYGDFVTIDATGQVTIYDSERGPRQGMTVSVVDSWRQVHPLSYTDIAGHREGECMLFLYASVCIRYCTWKCQSRAHDSRLVKSF